MRLEQLRYLLAIDKNHSINVASQELYISQQSISKAIQQLEDELQVTLLHRTNHGTTLTEEGTMVLASAKTIFSEIDALDKALQDYKNPAATLQGTLRIAHNNLFDYNYLLTSIQAFNKCHPNITIVSQQRFLPNVLELVWEGKIDVGLLNMTSEFHLSDVLAPEKLLDLSVVPLSQDALLAMVSKRSPLSHFNALSLRTILKHPLIQILNETSSSESKNENNSNWILDLLQRHGTPNFIMTVDSLPLYLNAIANNIGIGFITNSNVSLLPKSYLETISILPIRPLLTMDNLYVFRTDASSNNLIATYTSFLNASPIL